MQWDLGLSTGKMPDWSRGIPRDREKQLEFAVVALTPGMSAEWLFHVLRMKSLKRTFGRACVRYHWDTAWPLAQQNVGTITLEDGWTMLKLIKPKKFKGYPPHWGSLALRHHLQDHTLLETAEELGVSINRVWRWKTGVFHPLTLQRLKLANPMAKDFMREDPTLRAPPYRNPDHPKWKRSRTTS